MYFMQEAAAKWSGECSNYVHGTIRNLLICPTIGYFYLVLYESRSFYTSRWDKGTGRYDRISAETKKILFIVEKCLSKSQRIVGHALRALSHFFAQPNTCSSMLRIGVTMLVAKNPSIVTTLHFRTYIPVQNLLIKILSICLHISDKFFEIFCIISVHFESVQNVLHITLILTKTRQSWNFILYYVNTSKFIVTMSEIKWKSMSVMEILMI